MDINFTMSDGLILRGTLLDNTSSNDLIIMLHSGGYERTEHGIKKINNGKKEYYNPEGNYTYLSNYLSSDAKVLLLDQRNHGQSGKNIDEVAMYKAIKSIDSSINAKKIIKALKEKDMKTLSEFKNPKLQELIKRPIIKDMSFVSMAHDLKEVIDELNKSGRYKNIHLVGTCMGGLVSALYLIHYPNNVKSLTLFSPLFLFDQVFLHPVNEFGVHKQEIIKDGKQYHMGNAIEGAKTIAEIASIKDYFYKKLFELDIPIFCIQGLDDALVPVAHQNALFASLKEYHDTHNLSKVYYAEISLGVHCLYDVLYPSLQMASEFIYSNLDTGLKRN